MNLKFKSQFSEQLHFLMSARLPSHTFTFWNYFPNSDRDIGIASCHLSSSTFDKPWSILINQILSRQKQHFSKHRNQPHLNHLLSSKLKWGIDCAAANATKCSDQRSDDLDLRGDCNAAGLNIPLKLILVGFGWVWTGVMDLGRRAGQSGFRPW